MAFDSVQMTSSVRTLALQGEIISADAGEKIWSARREMKNPPCQPARDVHGAWDCHLYGRHLASWRRGVGCSRRPFARRLSVGYTLHHYG